MLIKKRLLILTNIISPYRIPFFNELSEKGGCSVKVVYVAEQERNRMWTTYDDEIKYDYTILRGLHIPFGASRTIHINCGFLRLLKRFSPDVIVVGTDLISSPASWVALFYAKKNNIPLVKYEAQHDYKHDINNFKRIIYRAYYQHCTAFFAYSVLTCKYLVSMGADPKAIVNGYNVGDTRLFRRKLNVTNGDDDNLCRRASYPKIIFVFIGHLTTLKGFDILLNAFFEANISDAGLVVLGDGPLRDLAEKFAKGPLVGKIFIEGFQQKNELVRFLSIADIFVLPTLSDSASISLGEAMHSGLFSIGSVYDGSACNFIKNGINGIIIDPTLNGALRRALVDASDKIRSAHISKEQVQESMSDFTVERYAQRLSQLIGQVTSI